MPKRPPSHPGQPGAVAQMLENARRLGTTLLLQNRPAEAIAPLEQAARRSGDPAIETLLGRALSAAGRADEALATLRQATARRPALPQAFLELGDQLGALGRFDEAAAAFEAGLALCPDAAVLRVGLGRLRLQRNDRAGARALFEAVRAAAPERLDAMVELARVTSLEGDGAAAAELYRRALELRPGDAALRIEFARCLLDIGQREAGEAALRAAAQGPGAPVGQAILALAAAPHGRFFLRPSAAVKFLGA
jgi:tetratricopeptide (TPR) repeat protein